MRPQRVRRDAIVLWSTHSRPRADAAARRPHRSRPQPFGVHARRPADGRCRDRDGRRLAGAVAGARVDRRSTPACTRASARSTSCRSSRSSGRCRPRRRCRTRRTRSASWWSETFAVPVFFYDDADDAGRDLPSVRRDAFRRRGARPRAARAAPATSGPQRSAPPHRSSRSTAARDRPTSRSRARSRRACRGRDGGLPGVRALGFLLEQVRRARRSR